MLTTTGQSPDLGTIKVPRGSNRHSSATPAMAERIVAAQSGGTCATIALVTGQVICPRKIPPPQTAGSPCVEAGCRSWCLLCWRAPSPMSYRNVECARSPTPSARVELGYPLRPMEICIFPLKAVASRIAQSRARDSHEPTLTILP
jgi:hypothetical protein